MIDTPSDPITVTIAEAQRRSGIGRTMLYELIKQNELESIRIGRRRLIVFASLKERLTGTD